MMAMSHVTGLIGGVGLLATGIWLASAEASSLPIEADGFADEDPVEAAKRGEGTMAAAAKAAAAASQRAGRRGAPPEPPPASTEAPGAHALPAEEAAEIERLRKEAEGR